jgi:hypothetical protein
LAIAAENIIKIFGKGGNNNVNCGYYSGNYNNCPNNGYQDKYGDPPGFRRISPYILEYVGKGDNYCGGYNNNFYNQQPNNGGFNNNW